MAAVFQEALHLFREGFFSVTAVCSGVFILKYGCPSVTAGSASTDLTNLRWTVVVLGVLNVVEFFHLD